MRCDENYVFHQLIEGYKSREDVGSEELILKLGIYCLPGDNDMTLDFNDQN